MRGLQRFQGVSGVGAIAVEEMLGVIDDFKFARFEKMNSNT